MANCLTRHRQGLVSLMLLLTAAVWGSSCLLMKNVQEEIPLNYVLAIRFSVVGLGLAYYLYAYRQKLNWTAWKCALITGSIVYLAYSIQYYGLHFTTVSKNAVFTALYVVMVPFLAWLVYRERISWIVYLAAVACFLGVSLISGLSGLGGLNKGDLWSLLGAVFYAGNFLAVTKCAEEVEIMPLTCLQFSIAALYAWIAALTTETFPQEIHAAIWGQLAWLAVMATLVAMTAMNLGIKYVSSSHTAIILATESFFACVTGIVFRGDPWGWQLIVGVSLIVGAVIATQLVKDSAPAGAVQPALASEARAA